MDCAPCVEEKHRQVIRLLVDDETYCTPSLENQSGGVLIGCRWDEWSVLLLLLQTVARAQRSAAAAAAAATEDGSKVWSIKGKSQNLQVPLCLSREDWYACVCMHVCMHSPVHVYEV